MANPAALIGKQIGISVPLARTSTTKGLGRSVEERSIAESTLGSKVSQKMKMND